MTNIRQFAAEVIRKEARALEEISNELPANFESAIECIRGCRGAVVVSGVGKAGLIGRKISATMASTGTRSFFLDPLNAFHGDLGMVDDMDVLLLLSNSGLSPELSLLADYGRSHRIEVISITGEIDSPLAKNSTICLDYGTVEEACPLRLAPSTSTVLMLALGDALALTVQHVSGFTESDFARYHPSGALGRYLKAVKEAMRPFDKVAIAEEGTPIVEVITRISTVRCGLCLIIGDGGQLMGVYTDGDFRRDAMERVDLNTPVGERCVRPGKRIGPEKSIGDALRIMRESRINALPVVDGSGKPLGLLDLQDLV